MASETEIWLRGNRRALVIGSAFPLLLGTLGLLAAFNLLPIQFHTPMRIAAGIMALLSALVGVALANQARLPRISYNRASNELLLFAGAVPFRIPIHVVEVFFGGQGETELQVVGHDIEARNVVVRLAEREKEWHHRDMRKSFGHWCEGYIQIKGAWCEPVTADLIKEMNHKLVEVKRELKNAAIS